MDESKTQILPHNDHITKTSSVSGEEVDGESNLLWSPVSQVVELDLSTVVPCCSGPKRPQDRIPVSDMKKDFETCLGAKVGTTLLLFVVLTWLN